jgi:hypothetical protein
MPTLVKHGSNGLQQFLDASNIIYGDGSDGNVDFSGGTVLSITPPASTYVLTRDIYCHNMFVGAGWRVEPNGYRIFVKNLLQLSSSSVIGWSSNVGSTAVGSIYGGGGAGGSVTHSLGTFSNASAGAGTATPPTAATGGSHYYSHPLNAIQGYSMVGSSAPTWLRGGAGGPTASGQKGGGIIICAARYISGPPTGFATFRADGDGGFGGSAGGGVIITISTQSTFPTASITRSAAGGAWIGAGQVGTISHIQAL